jgi:hypothetical protein
MAAQNPGLDPANLNYYGADPADVADYQKSLQESVDALQARYANPNWFNVAAGFLKPQLGGFAASLGSAGQAMGENLEKQRESALPVAQMKAQLALSKIKMGQGKTAEQVFSDWQKSNKPMDEATYSKLVALSPGSAVATAAQKAYEGERAGQGVLAQQQTLRQAQAGQALNLLQQQYSSGAIDRDAYQAGLSRIETSYGPTQPVTPARPVGAPGTTGKAEGAPMAAAVPAAVPAAPPAFAVKMEPTGGAGPAANRLREIQSMPPEQQQQALAEFETIYGTKAQGTSVTPPKEKIVIESPLAKSGLDPQTYQDQVNANELSARARFDALEKTAGPMAFKQAEAVMKDQMDLIRKNPAIAREVTSILSKGDLASQIGTMFEKGVGINIGGVSGNIHLPIADMKRAGFTDKQREIAQAMVNNYSKIAVNYQRLNNVNPNAASNAEANLYNGIVPSMETTPNVALRALGHLLTDLRATNAQYNFVNDVYQNRHPNVSVDPKARDRLSSIIKHPSFDAVYDPFSQEHKDLSAAFQRHTNPSAAKP